ncbi:MAG: hypothetical protein ACYTEK_10275 [Planctomycetota bacterium]|jgi:hypothetical protein
MKAAPKRQEPRGASVQIAEIPIHRYSASYKPCLTPVLLAD